MKLAASYLLGHPNWHRPDPGLCPQCEEEIETTEHALLRCPAHQYARRSPETLDLKPAWYDATATEMLANFVRRTFTAYPPGFTSPENNSALPHPPLPLSLLARVRRLYLLLPLINCIVQHVSIGYFFWLSSGFSLVFAPVLFLLSFSFYLICNVWWRGF